jgi:hypothetical protein
MLFIPLFVAFCVKLDPGTHKGMRSVLVQELDVIIGEQGRKSQATPCG